MKKFLIHFRYGEKGFTLIELLVVIAILGVLAAVVVPNVSRFMGQGKNESGLTELHSVQTAVTAMMADLGIVEITTPKAVPENDMSKFPTEALGPEDVPYALFTETAHYLQKVESEYWYTCESDGTVRGWWIEAGGDGFEIGVDDAP